MTPEFALQLVSVALAAVGGAGGAYVAIRADLAAVKVTAVNAKESASEAHQRIDNILMKGK